MSKKDFVALADTMRQGLMKDVDDEGKVYAYDVAEDLIAFCKSQNPRFDEARWRGYLAGTCGPNGGAR